MLISLLKLIRWRNLVIVFITQSIVWFHLTSKTLSYQNLTSNLSLLQFILLSLCTVLVAAAGYIINDIEDIKIDLINKPEKVIVGKYIMEKTCYSIYYLMLGIGFAIALVLAWQLDSLPYVLLYPLSSGALHAYATHLKKTTLLGNILVSLFVAAVPMLVYLADADQISMAQNTRVYSILALYSTLAFLANLAREVVKDMQDLKGDKVFGAHTFPIRYGFTNTKYLIHLILMIILLILGYWSFVYDAHFQNAISIGFGSIPLMLIALGLMIYLASLKTATEFGKWSLGIKIFMLFGLIFLYLQPL